MAELTVTELLMMQQGLSDRQKMLFMSQYNATKKDRTTALILSVVLGILGVDRFYVGDTGLGILKLCTFGGCLVWKVVDWFLISNRADQYNRAQAHELLSAVKLMG